MSVAPYATPVNPDRAREALAELEAGRGELEHFLEEIFGQWERLGQQCSERQRATVAHRQQIEQQLREQAEELRRQRASIEEEKQRIREQVRREVSEAAAEFAEAMVQQRRQMAEERAQWLEEITRMRQLLELVARRGTATSGK